MVTAGESGGEPEPREKRTASPGGDGLLKPRQNQGISIFLITLLLAFVSLWHTKERVFRAHVKSVQVGNAGEPPESISKAFSRHLLDDTPSDGK